MVYEIYRFCKKLGDEIANEGDSIKHYRLLENEAPNKTLKQSLKGKVTKAKRDQRTLQSWDRKYCRGV